MGARRARGFRIAWTIAEMLLVQTFVCAVAMGPVALLWRYVLVEWRASDLQRAVAVSVLAVPSYVLFALGLMFVSACAMRVLRWQTPPDVHMSIAAVEWPLLRWVQSMVATHLVRLVAGALFRGSPVWTFYLRVAGARLGRRVYVNSLAVTDYNLLEMGDDVVIGDDAHVSGHTVEGGYVRTAPVRLGSRVNVGLGSVIQIGTVIEDGCQVGALSFVPKFARLRSGGTYVGIPAALARQQHTVVVESVE